MKYIKIFIAVVFAVISMQFAKAGAVTTALSPTILQGPPPPPPLFHRHHRHYRHYRRHHGLNVHIHLPPRPPGPPPPPGPPQ